MRICIRYCKSRENLYQVLQVTCAVSKSAMKSKVHMIKSYHHSTKLYRKISLVCCHWHCYSCCALVTIQMATNLWYFPVQLCTVVIIISYHIISYHIISYHIISYHIISYHINHIIYHIISYQSYHIISYHIISHHDVQTIISPALVSPCCLGGDQVVKEARMSQVRLTFNLWW